MIPDDEIMKACESEMDCQIIGEKLANSLSKQSTPTE